MTQDRALVLDRGGETPDLVIRYGPAAEHVVDVHLPAGDPVPRPLLVLVHGGFWREAYDRTHTRPLADALRRAGYVVATPEYRRVGGTGGWPQTFDDLAAVRSALLGLLGETAPGRVRADPPVLVGHSAGGHLALWWALGADADVRPARVVSLAPVADLARAYEERLGGGAVGDLLGGGPLEVPERYAMADVAPRLAAYPAAEALHVLHGDLDDQVPVEHSRSLTGVCLHELAGIDHYALIDPLSPAWPVLLAALR